MHTLTDEQFSNGEVKINVDTGAVQVKIDNKWIPLSTATSPYKH